MGSFAVCNGQVARQPGCSPRHLRLACGLRRGSVPSARRSMSAALATFLGKLTQVHLQPGGRCAVELMSLASGMHAHEVWPWCGVTAKPGLDD